MINLTVAQFWDKSSGKRRNGRCKREDNYTSVIEVSTYSFTWYTNLKWANKDFNENLYSTETGASGSYKQFVRLNLTGFKTTQNVKLTDRSIARLQD